MDVDCTDFQARRCFNKNAEKSANEIKALKFFIRRDSIAAELETRKWFKIS